MIDAAIGFVAGVVVGHYFPMVYTWFVSLFDKAESTVESATDDTTK
jgi:hypothetical protein